MFPAPQTPQRLGCGEHKNTLTAGLNVVLLFIITCVPQMQVNLTLLQALCLSPSLSISPPWVHVLSPPPGCMCASSVLGVSPVACTLAQSPPVLLSLCLLLGLLVGGGIYKYCTAYDTGSGGLLVWCSTVLWVRTCVLINVCVWVDKYACVCGHVCTCIRVHTYCGLCTKPLCVWSVWYEVCGVCWTETTTAPARN